MLETNIHSIYVLKPKPYAALLHKSVHVHYSDKIRTSTAVWLTQNPEDCSSGSSQPEHRKRNGSSQTHLVRDSQLPACRGEKRILITITIFIAKQIYTVYIYF